MGQTLYTFNGGGTTGNWTDATTWTTDPTGSTSVGAHVPADNESVVITNSFVVLLNTQLTTKGHSITVQRGGVLDLTSTTANAFPTALTRLAGQGTLRIARPYFPDVTNNDFDDANTGTVEFYNWPAGPTVLPQPLSGAYNNLRLLNSKEQTPTAYVAQLNNNLTLNGNLALTRTDNAEAVTLNLGGPAANSWTLKVLGDITLGRGTLLGVTAVTGTHALNVSGSFINNGTVNLHNGTANDNQVAVLNFLGGADANFACNGPTDLDLLKVDKGTASKVLLNVTSQLGAGSQGNLRLNHVGNGDLLVLTNGITKLGRNIYLAKIHNGAPADLANSAGWYQLGSATTSPTLWISGATVINDNATLFAVYGTYRIDNGSLTSVNDGGMVIREDAQVLIEGGITTVNKFRPSSTAATHRGSFTMTGGLFQSIGKYASSFDDQFARFAVPYSTQAFRMSGGVIELSNPGGSGDGFLHIGVNPNNAIVSGGTIKLSLSPLPNGTANDGRILTTAPLWNLSISKPATSSAKAVLSAMTLAFTGGTTAIQPLTVLNDFTIDGGANALAFDAASQAVTIQGSFTIGSNATYLTGTNTTTFSGGLDQLLTNNGTIGATAALIGTAGTNIGTFSSWTIDKPAGTLTLAGTNATFAVTGTLSLLNGVLNDGGKTINARGNIVNSASHTSGGGSGSIVLAGTGGQIVSGNGNGVFGNLRLNSTATAGTVAATLTANMSVANTLTMASNNILAIGDNRLALTNVLSSALATGPGISFSTSCFIQTAGNQSDLGLQKTYGRADTFVFPVGTGVGTTARYAPASIELRVNSAPLEKFGQVSVSPTSSRNPFVTGTNSSLNYYWKVRSTGFGPISPGSIYEKFTMTNADAGTSNNTSATTKATAISTYYIPGRYQPVAWAKYATSDMEVGPDLSNINFNALDAFEGEFTAGYIQDVSVRANNVTTVYPAAFGPITAYYTRLNGDWGSASTWSTVDFNGPAASVPPGSNNPVFIGSFTQRIYHTVKTAADGARAGSLVIDRGSVLDVGTTTSHNFGALPDSKVGGSGRLRVSSAIAAPAFPGGDFGSFIQADGGTVEYYTTGTQNFTVPAKSGSLTLSQYRSLWVNAGSGRTITLPPQDLRVYAQFQTGVANGATAYPGTVLFSTSAAGGNLRVDSLLAVQAGTLRLQGTTTRALTADTDVQVASGATFEVLTDAGRTHTLAVGGSLVNNGTLEFRAGTGLVALTFLNGRDAYLNSVGPLTDLATLTVNKGLGRAAVLNMEGSGLLTTPTNSWLNLVNGTLRFAKPSGGDLTIHDQASSYLLTDNAGLTVDAPGATATVATASSALSDLKLAGAIQVLQGTLNVGKPNSTTNVSGNDLEYASAGAPSLKVSGNGTLYVNGQLRRTVNNLDGALRYDQSGGTVTIDGYGATATQSNERGLFEVQGAGSIFSMSGGTLSLRRSNNNPSFTADLYLAPDSTVVSGGLVLLGNSNATPVTISVSSAVPLYDLKVDAGVANGTNTGLLAGVLPLTLKGSLTIANDFSFFNANGLGLNIYQDLINNNTSASAALTGGGFQPTTTTQTTTFVGGTDTQRLTGTAANLTSFGSLVLNTPKPNGTLLLGGNAQVAGTLTLTKGTLADNGKTLTVLGNVLNSAVHTSSGTGSLILAGSAIQTVGGNDKGRFGNLTLNNGAGAITIANQEITGVLALNSGVLSIGSNLLWLSNPAANAVTGFGTTRFIRTNGIVADLGVRKNYPAGSLNFTFPVGAAAKYTPVQMNVTANAAAGTLTVQPIDVAHPSTTGTGTNKISFYWKVSSSLSAPTVSQQFTYGDNDVAGLETAYKVGRFYKGMWQPTGGIANSSVNAATNTLLNPDYAGTGGSIDGDYTGGDASEFGLVPTFYSRNTTAGLAAGALWANATAWTYNPDGSDSAPLPTRAPTLANPVVIRSGHRITATPASASSTASSLGAANLVLDGILDLGIYGANNFNTVTGTGTVRIGSALFPAGNYSAFVAANGGTVDYSGAVQLPARDTYNNLTFSGNNSKQLSNLDLTINGTLAVAAGTTVSNPTSQNITLASGTSGATLDGTFNLNDGTLTTGAFLANGGTLNLGAGLVSVGTAFTNSGTVNNGTGNVSVGTAFANSGTYNANVGTGSLSAPTFANSGDFVAGTGPLAVSGDFSNTAPAGKAFVASTGPVVVGGNLSNAGFYTVADGVAGNLLRVDGNFSNLATGSFRAASSTLALQGNFTNNNGLNFDAGAGLVQFITSTSSLLVGNTSFYNVQKLSPANLVLNANTTMTVTNVLTLRAGLITTGTTSTVALTNTATQPIVGNSTTSYISGRLQMRLPNAAASIRVFPVGLGGRYRPVTITPQATSAAPVVLVEIFNSSPGTNFGNTLSNISANRYYRIQLQSGTIGQPTVQLSFNTDVQDEQVGVPGNLRVARATTPTGVWNTANGAGVFSPSAPRGYTTSAPTVIDASSFFALASTQENDNPLTGTVPLPVQLLSFTAARQGTAVRTAWATASEKNSAHFVVQRSADGRTFSDVQQVAAQGNSLTRHDYAALDAQPLPGLSYYRLRQVDLDGTVAYSPVATVRFGDALAAPAPTLVAYPNPSAGQHFQVLATNLATTGGTVQVFDNVGRLVLTQVAAVGTAEVTIQPARPLASGLYLVTWQTADGQKLTTKVAVD